jgi:hypothetical protein
VLPTIVREEAYYVVTDGTVRGYRTLLSWIDEHPNRDSLVLYRYVIPFSESHDTPAEYARAESQEKIRGMARDCTERCSFEVVRGPFVRGEENEWPWPHRGCYQDIVGNALYGETVLTTPLVATGLSRLQQWMMALRGEHPGHELCCLLAGRTDLDYSTVRTYYLALPAAFDSTLPPLLDFFQAGELLAMAKKYCKKERVDQGHCKVGKKFVGARGVIVHCESVDDVMALWVKARVGCILEEQRKREADPFTKWRRDFVRSLVLRQGVVPNVPHLCFFDLDEGKKKAYLESQGLEDDVVERLLDLPVRKVGRELFGEIDAPEDYNPKAPLPLYPTKDVYDLLLDSLTK